jgi:chromatin remodeling complex protein RSC6
MNPEAQEHLDELLKRSLASLSTEDVAFIAAREEYIPEDQIDRYSKLISKHREAVVQEQKALREQNKEEETEETEKEEEPKTDETKNQTSEESEPVKKNANSK